MKKTWSSLFILTLVLALLAGCGGGGNTKSGSNSGGQTGQTGNTGTASGNSGNSGTQDEIVELSLFINHSWYPVRSWTGTIAEEITKRTGVKLNVTVAADSEQLPLMIASGDLPDLIFTVREPRLENPDMSYPWNELIEKYAPDFQIDPVRLAVNTAPDGNVYTVLNAFATPDEWASNPYALGNDGNPGIAVRQDILDGLGARIETIDDFLSVLEQVKQKHPDMVPMTMDIEWIPQYFKMQFGIPPHSSWHDQDGQLKHVISHPNALKFYKFMNSLYRKGYILAENFTYSNDQIDDEYAVTGRAFAHSHTVSIAEADNAKAKNQGKDYQFTMIPSALTDEAYNLSTGTGFSGVYITKNNKNPQKSIEFIKFLASKEGLELVMFGIEGKHWEWHPDGYPVFHYDVNDGDYVNSEGLKWWYLYSDAIVEGLRGYVPGTQTTKALQEIKAITENKPEIGMVKLQDGTDEKIIFDKIREMVKTEEVRIYLAESEEAAEQAYQKMLQLAEDIGLGKLESWATAEYQKAKAKFE
jgi:ABC-type sugar transport system, periplasmic component